MTKKIITTIGTSLFTNYMRKEVRESIEFNGDYEPIDKEISDLEDVGYPAGAEHETALVKIENTIKNYWLSKKRPKASAEISSLLKIAESEKGQVYLLATETALSVIAGRLIYSYLTDIEKDKFIDVFFDERKHVVEGLQVRDAALFETVGLENLVRLIKEISVSKEDILNVSGGYKALIPPLTIIAQLFSLKLSYLYEDSAELIEINKFPINFDWFLIEKYVNLVNNDNKRNDSANKALVEEMRELNIVKKDSTDLTTVGNILKYYMKRESPYSGTIMGYFIEHKLFKFFLTSLPDDKVQHSYDSKVAGVEGDIDLLICKTNGIIPIEVKPLSVLENEYNSWEKLLVSFSKRIGAAKVKLDKDINEIWLILYSYSASKYEKPSPFFTEEQSKEVDRMVEALKEFKCTFRVKHLAITESNLAQERYLYQGFIKSDIKVKDLTDVFETKII